MRKTKQEQVLQTTEPIATKFFPMMGAFPEWDECLRQSSASLNSVITKIEWVDNVSNDTLDESITLVFPDESSICHIRNLSLADDSFTRRAVRG